MIAPDPATTLDAIDSLVRRARVASHAFAEGDADPELDEVRHLLDEAAATSPDADRSRWRAACEELGTFLAEVEQDLRYVAVVRSPSGAATWVGWGGTTATAVGPGGGVATQVEAVRAAVEPRMRRLRLLTLALSAAARIATVVSIGGSGLALLPIAWRLVRTVTGLVQSRNDQ